MIAFDVLAVVLCGFLDRMRGDPRHIINRTVEKLLYGLAAAWLTVGFNEIWIGVAFAALFAIGSSPGWGEVLHSALYDKKMRRDHLEKWQFGALRDEIPLALGFRGFLWALPCLALIAWDKSALEALFMCPVFVGSVYLTRWMDKKHGFEDIWATNEIVRGLLFGVCCASV